MSDHVTALDATFLELEESSESAHMHIGAVMAFDPLPGGGTPSLDDVRTHLAQRLPAMPRFGQRLSTPHTGGLTWPTWESDPDFDVGAHLVHAALPSPGDEHELTTWAADFWSRRLDRSGPLWEIALVEGLAGGGWALVTKTHHCMVDGVGSVDVGHLLLDVSPNPPRRHTAAPAAPGEGPDEPAAGHWPGELLGTLAHLPEAVLHRSRAALSAVGTPSGLRELVERSRAMAELLLRDELIAAPSSSLNRPTGAGRRYGIVHARLDDLRLVKRELGGTVNDVALAVATGGLRALLVARGEEPPDRGLRAMVPVNVRTTAEQLTLGNRITSLFVHLPVAEREPLGRYAEVLREAEGLKSGNQALGSSTLLDLTSAAPPLVHAFLARSLFASRLFNVTITNVPGPRATLYAFGAPLREVFGLVPLAADHAIGIAILSYDGRVTFGINADYDSVPDLDVLVSGMEGALEELLHLAHASVVARADEGAAPAPTSAR